MSNMTAQKDSVTGNPVVQKSIDGAACVTDPNNINLMDDTGTYTYFGSALSGTAEGTATWTISRMTNATKAFYPAIGAVSWTGRAAASYG